MIDGKILKALIRIRFDKTQNADEVAAGKGQEREVGVKNIKFLKVSIKIKANQLINLI